MTFNILSILAHVRWRASSEKILARRCEDVDHLGILLAPSLMLNTAGNDSEFRGKLPG
jgi:hypothetical protein